MADPQSSLEILRIRSSSARALSGSIQSLALGFGGALLLSAVMMWLGLPFQSAASILAVVLVSVGLTEFWSVLRRSDIVVYQDRIVGPGRQQLPLEEVIPGGFLESNEFGKTGRGGQRHRRIILGNSRRSIVIPEDRYEPDDLEMLRALLARHVADRNAEMEPIVPGLTWPHVAAQMSTEEERS